MKRLLSFLGRAVAGGVRGFGSLVLWSVWLVLGVTLVGQIYIATTSQLAVPQFIMREAEARLAEAGLRASFQHTAFDPNGRVLVQDVELAPIGYTDPVLKARAIYLEVNPWMLAVGRFEPREIRIMGASASVPAMVSGTGAPVVLLRDVEATLRPVPRALEIAQLTARVANVVVTARGTLPLPRAKQTPQASLAEFFSQRFPGLCRQALAAAAKADALQSPSLQIELEPAESGEPAATLLFSAARLTLEEPAAVEARDLQVTTRVLLLEGVPSISHLRTSVAGLRSPLAGGVEADGVRAEIFGRLAGTAFEIRTIELEIDALSAAGVPVRGLAAQLFPRPLPRLDADFAALVAGAPLHVHAEADLAAKTASLGFDGPISPQVLDLISARTKVDVRRSFDFDHAEIARGTARFGPAAPTDGRTTPSWHFEGLEARVTLGEIRARGVTFNEGRATVQFDGKRFYSPEAYARIGANFARGTYEHELATHRYRFLLDGRLRPMDIRGWFTDWWPNFFRDYEFPTVPPEASVEVAGVWRQGPQSSVFVFADAPQPIIRGAALDHVHTRLFIRPTFFRGLELRGKHGDGTLNGTFTLRLNPATRAWQSLDIDAASSVPLPLARQLIGAAGEKLLAPFALANAPQVRLRGSFEGPGSPTGRHSDVSITAASSGEFRFFNFPLQDVSFAAQMKDEEISLDRVEARFAGGIANGKARVWGSGEARRVGFDFNLKDASLGLAAGALQEFVARQKGRPPAPPGKFIQEKANVRIDLSTSAQGKYNDPLSYRGEGFAVLSGAEIGEVPLLGGLSEVLKFATLRFTSARANFKIEGPKLAFSEVAIRGANSAIDAHGDYLLDKHELDFNAKILPFHESGNLLKSVVGAVLTPLSNVFEVKLTGSFEKPVWNLALGYRAPTPETPVEKPAAATVPPPPAVEATPRPPTT